MKTNRERALELFTTLPMENGGKACAMIERSLDEAVAEAVRNTIAETRDVPIRYGEVVMTIDNIARLVKDAVSVAVAPFMDAIEIEDGIPVAVDWNLLAQAARNRSKAKP